VFIERHPRRSRASFHGLTSIPCPLSPKSLPLNLFADPHPLNLVTSIFYKNSGGRAYPELHSPACPDLIGDPVGITARPRLKSFNCNTYEPPHKCCKQKTYAIAKPFRCNTYKKPGGTSSKPNNFLSPLVSRRSNVRTSRPVPSNSPYTLPSFVSCKSSICHSYANTGGVGVFFPLWNSSRGVGASTHLRAIIGLPASPSAEKTSHE